MAQLVRQHFVELLCVFGAFQLSNSSLTYWYGCLQLRPRSVKSCPVWVRVYKTLSFSCTFLAD